jgi:hypothetical protein
MSACYVMQGGCGHHDHQPVVAGQPPFDATGVNLEQAGAGECY